MGELVRSVCLRDCPDACGLLCETDGGRVTKIAGDPDHPVTRGFLCRRTQRDYPGLLTRPDRIVRPRLRTPSGWRDIGWDEALDLCADRLQAVIDEHGPAAVLFLQSGGDMGLSAEVCRALFDALQATTVAGGVCLDAGEWAQQEDFGSIGYLNCRPAHALEYRLPASVRPSRDILSTRRHGGSRGSDGAAPAGQGSAGAARWAVVQRVGSLS